MTLQNSIEQRFGLPTNVGADTESNETLNTIFNHRSHREFANQPISQDLMETLLRAAFVGPSKSDLQQARAIWVRDPDLKRQIADLSPELHPWVASAPEFVVWCGDNSLCHQLAESHGHPYVNNHLDQFMNPAVDAGIAMTTFIWAAESKGLGCCPVSSIRNTPFELANILKLPKFVFPVAGLVIGYPLEGNETEISLRLPPSISIMENTYRNDPDTILQEVEDYSSRRSANHPVSPSDQRATEVFGVTDNYGWPEDKSRQYALPERTDWADFIRSQGFEIE